jgi:Flp pilus assembly protein TadD
MKCPPVRLGVLAVAAALAGCAVPTGDAPSPLRVEPVLRVSGEVAATAAGYRALGRQYAGEARWTQAADAYRQAAALEPANTETFNGLGHAEAMLLRYANAVAAFERAVELAPARADLLNNLGYALILDGRPAQAGSVLERALLREPDYAAARANLNLAQQHVATAQAPYAAAAATATTASPPQQTVAALALPAPASHAMSLLTEPNLPALRLVTASLPPLFSPTTPEVTDSAATIGFTPGDAVQLFDTLLPVAIAPPAMAPTRASAPAAETRIVLVNGNGVTGLAGRLGRLMGTLGLRHTRLANLPPYDTVSTVVHYRAGFEPQAREIARLLPMPSTLRPAPAGSADDVRVIIGHDVTLSQACAELAACRPKVLLADSRR